MARRLDYERSNRDRNARQNGTFEIRDRKATEKQLAYLSGLYQEIGLTRKQIKAKGLLRGLSCSEASLLIKQINQKIKKEVLAAQWKAWENSWHG